MVNKFPFGTDKNGAAVTRYELTDGNLKVSLIDRGATVHFIEFCGKRVSLGYDTVADYEQNDGYLGATIGRYGNRIAGGKFGKYDVGRNENGITHLHGGILGYDKQMWSEKQTGDNFVTFALSDRAADNGYPGDVTVSVTFTADSDALIIDYHAETTADTPINLTNHTYFNLNGDCDGDVLDTKLKINATRFLPVDEKLLPLGILRKVAGTPFDFTELKAIGKDIAQNDRQLKIGGGYDHNFCLGGEGFRPAAQAFCEKSGIIMACYTDQPGLQLYTGNCLDSTAGFAGYGKEAGYGKHGAFCLETQHYPDSVHFKEFPNVWLKAGENYDTRTAYAFSMKEE